MSWPSELSGPIEIEDSTKVVLGKNGFLFQKFDQAFEQLCGTVEVRQDQIARWVSLIESRHAWCQARGIPYIFAVTPEKLAVYPDCLPDGFSLNARRPIKRIFEALSPSVRSSCLYYDETLRTARSAGDTFYRTDIHWTQLGALAAYNEIAKITNGMVPEISLSSIKIVERNFAGEFSFHLKKRISEKTVAVQYTPPRQYKKIFSKLSFKEGQIEIYETPEAAGGTLIFFRDSNGTALLRHLLPHFSRAIVVASQRMFHEVIRSEPCTLIITQMAERYLSRLDETGAIGLFPDDFGPKGFSETTGAAVPLPSGRQIDAGLDIDLCVGGNAEAFLGSGWSNPEQTHRWAVGSECTVQIPASAVGGPSTIEFSLLPFVDNPQLPAQRAVVFLNDLKQHTRSISSADTITLPVPDQLQGRDVTLKIVTPDASAPNVLGVGPETRVLSFSFDHIYVRRGQ